MPLAVGAAVACPDRKLLSLQADGSALYTFQALWTQAREGLDITTILFSNRGYESLKGELFKVGANPGRTALDMLEINEPQLDWTSLARGMGVEAERVMAGPLPANPFTRDVIVLLPGRYEFVEVDWLAGGAEHFRISHPSLPRGAPDPIVQAALEAPQVRGFVNWLRFPTWRVEEQVSGYRVVLQDVRYSRTPSAIGTEVVELDRQLHPR